MNIVVRAYGNISDEKLIEIGQKSLPVFHKYTCENTLIFDQVRGPYLFVDEKNGVFETTSKPRLMIFGLEAKLGKTITESLCGDLKKAFDIEVRPV